MNVSVSHSAASEAEELLQLANLLPVAVARFDMDGAVEMLNPKAVSLLESLGINTLGADAAIILDRLHPGLAQFWRASAARLGPVVPLQRVTVLGVGSVPQHLMLQVVRPNKHFTVLVIEDVSALVEQERELLRQRRRLDIAFESIQGYCVLMLDPRGTVTEWNPSIGRFFGGTVTDVVGEPLLKRLAADTAHPEPAIDFAGVRSAIANQGWCQLSSPWRKMGGQLLWGECVITPVVGVEGAASGYVAVIRDTTDEHPGGQKLTALALTDALTGIYNRRGLERRVEAVRARTHGVPALVSWIVLDIDHFKRVNDTYGHAGGDAVLKAVVVALQSTLRDGDILARMSGEQFVLLLAGAPEAAPASVAERLRLRIQGLVVEAEGRQMRVTASLGVAQQGLGEAQSAVLERASSALTRAKHEGRNRVIVAPASGE